MSMQGQLERRPNAINYTGVATPLSFDGIQRDLWNSEAKDIEIGVLVMWEHQLDWLRKLAKIVPQPALAAEHFEIRLRGSWSRVKGDEPDTIFGVPVEIRHA